MIRGPWQLQEDEWIIVVECLGLQGRMTMSHHHKVQLKMVALCANAKIEIQTRYEQI